MKLKVSFVAAILAISAPLGCAFAKKVDLSGIKYRGPVSISSPWMADSVDVNNKKFNPANLLKVHSNYKKLNEVKGDSVMMIGGEECQIHFFSLPLRNTRFADLTLNVEGSDNYQILLDGKESENNLKLKPGSYDLTIKALTLPGEKDTLRIGLTSPQAEYISLSSGAKRAYTLEDVLYTRHFKGVDVSPSGKYAILPESLTTPDGTTVMSYKLMDLKEGKTKGNLQDISGWMPGEDLLFKTQNETDGTISIYSVDPVTFVETVFAENIPEGDFIISPDKKRLVYTTHNEGPKEDEQIYRVINPEDRQPGWRDRAGVAVYDLESGVYRPITFGSKNMILQDVSGDGKKLLLMSMRSRFEKRPTTVFSIFEYDLNNNKVDTLVFEDGFITGVQYSPDAKKVVITGSPESLNRIGMDVPEGRIPNMTEGEFFIMDIASKNIEPATKKFNPSVQNIEWNKGNGKIFFRAEDKDKVSLFSFDPTTGIFADMNAPEELVTEFSISENGTTGGLIGESATNPDNFYAFDFKKGVPAYRMLGTTGDKLLAEAELAEVVPWDFVNSVGDTINGRLYLPPGFDPDKKYPLIVNYYGGCSPTSRYFASRYPHHLYANQGYVVYVLNPSGATGFGQEFASRHVNTAGEGVARDIIEGTTKLAEENPFINKDKIGCIGASYGGFMTQYLQTVSDIFAAAISHAGISDHTSYWGFGYWGYSYSEVSMAESYPWSDQDLYVKQSPLYNADKINTPILFVHGDGDTNVPPNESIQLFTALTLLGKDTALVEVTDQNHHILDFDKRKKWQDTIFAWFAKYLQDDPTWWNELYPPSSL